MPRIEFHALEKGLGAIPHPYPAGRHIPDWLKEMPPDFEEGATLKRCPPFLAAMTAGYIIPAPFDATLVMNAQGEFSARGTVNFLSTHFPSQVQGAPFGAARVVKFENPWLIVTPPEYVCMITAPVNRFEIPFTALSGIVETGMYYREVHLPMACTMRPGESFRLERGAPMIQVIPIRREDWESGVGTINDARRAEQQAMLESTPHFYKERFWQKVQFS
ncbi:MAG: hypothetical protein QOE14_1833 [Humisphaera sp.]|nr:hypothetical protein [Humisphaera sp.]